MIKVSTLQYFNSSNYLLLCDFYYFKFEYECFCVCCRPGRAGVNATGRGVLSMSGLSFGVVRVDQENSLTSLTLQDCGQVMPGCKFNC